MAGWREGRGEVRWLPYIEGPHGTRSSHITSTIARLTIELELADMRTHADQLYIHVHVHM